MDVSQLFGMLDKIEKTEENEEIVKEIRTAIEEGDYKLAMDKINELNNLEIYIKENDEDEEDNEKKASESQNKDNYYNNDDEGEKEESKYPEKLINEELEESFIGMLLNNPKAISMYYILFEDCYFESGELLDIYKVKLLRSPSKYSILKKSPISNDCPLNN